MSVPYISTVIYSQRKCIFVDIMLRVIRLSPGTKLNFNPRDFVDICNIFDNDIARYEAHNHSIIPSGERAISWISNVSFSYSKLIIITAVYYYKTLRFVCTCKYTIIIWKRMETCDCEATKTGWMINVMYNELSSTCAIFSRKINCYDVGAFLSKEFLISWTLHRSRQMFIIIGNMCQI